MICCDVKGEGCKICDCVGITKTQGKRMERNNEEYVCPVCLTAAETVAQLPLTPLYHQCFLGVNMQMVKHLVRE